MTAAPAPTGQHPPSDGAHRLAWWLADIDARLTWRVHDAVGDLLTRLLTGEVEPSDELAADFAELTGGAVRPEDWTRGGPLGWADRPYARD